MKKLFKIEKPHNMSKRDFIFEKNPMWKSIFLVSMPSVIMMLFFGAYSFADSILSVNFAADSYENDIYAQMFGPKDFVRMTMASTAPINILIMSFSLFLAVGISTRASINLGANKKQQAVDVLKTGFQISMIVSLLLMVVLYFISPAWVGSQYPEASFGTVKNTSFQYIKIFILAVPFMVFANIFSSLFILEGRSKEMLAANILPIIFNLFLDWVFMGPAKMGVEGGAIATVLSQVLSVLMFIVFIIIKKGGLLHFRYFFGNIKTMATFGILLVGIATFIRYFSNSLMQTAQFNIIKDISADIYSDDARKEVAETINKYISNAPGSTTSDSFRAINGAYYQIAEKFKLDLKLPKGFSGQLFLTLPEVSTKSMTSIHPEIQAFLKISIKDLTSGKLPVTNITPQMLSMIDLSKIDFNLFANYQDGTFGDVLLDKLSVVKARTHMSIYASGAFPILMLLFPSLFGFIQGSVPIISYNYGAKNIKRVKEGYKWNIIYSFLTTVIIYFVGGFALVNPLLDVLGVSAKFMYESRTSLIILLATVPLLSVGISGMVILQATDYVILSTIASGLHGIITFYPIQYMMKGIALQNTDTWWLYFIGTPLGAALSSIMVAIIVLFVFKHIKKRGVITIDQKIITIKHKFTKRFIKNKKH